MKKGTGKVILLEPQALLTEASRSSSTTWVDARRRRSNMTTASRISG